MGDFKSPKESPLDEKKFFPCKSCGGELVFDPETAKLKCTYCDSLFDIPSDASFVPEEQETDLMEFLSSEPLAKGYGVTLFEVQCKQCGAAVSSQEKRRDVTCPFCGTSFIGESKEKEQMIRPAGIVPFSVGKDAALKKFSEWIKEGWFRPNALKKLARLEKIQGVYLPFFTVDAKAESTWTAQAGYYYYVSESVPVTRNGKTSYETRQVRKIRWEPASGSRSDFFDDVLVPAIFSERLISLYNIFPFDVKKGMKPYDPGYLSGFGVFNSELMLKEVYAIARSQIESSEVSLCGQDVPGDTHQDLRVRTILSGQTFKHVLNPIWSGTFRYNNRNYPFLVNGQTGMIYGKKPYSFWKIFFALASAAAFLLLFLILAGLLGGKN